MTGKELDQWEMMAEMAAQADAPVFLALIAEVRRLQSELAGANVAGSSHRQAYEKWRLKAESLEKLAIHLFHLGPGGEEQRAALVRDYPFLKGRT